MKFFLEKLLKYKIRFAVERETKKNWSISKTTLLSPSKKSQVIQISCTEIMYGN